LDAGRPARDDRLALAAELLRDRDLAVDGVRDGAREEGGPDVGEATRLETTEVLGVAAPAPEARADHDPPRRVAPESSLEAGIAEGEACRREAQRTVAIHASQAQRRLAAELRDVVRNARGRLPLEPAVFRIRPRASPLVRGTEPLDAREDLRHPT